jgi:methionyl-tRNA synthetase
MHHLVEPLRIISGLLWPFMPETAEKLQGYLGLTERGADLTLDRLKDWGENAEPGPLGKAVALFPRVEPGGEKKQAPEKGKQEKKKARARAEEAPSESGLLSFQAFQGMDLRVGTVIRAEDLVDSKKLLQLTVDIGEERTVVAGLKGHYEPGDLVGRQVIIVANLKPVKLMGVESRGMVLAAEDEAGVHLLAPDVETAVGSKVR